MTEDLLVVCDVAGDLLLGCDVPVDLLLGCDVPGDSPLESAAVTEDWPQVNGAFGD